MRITLPTGKAFKGTVKEFYKKQSNTPERLLLQYNSYINNFVEEIENTVTKLENEETQMSIIDLDILIESFNKSNDRINTIKNICQMFSNTLEDIEAIDELRERIRKLLLERKNNLNRKIDFADFVVKTNVFKCNSLHDIEQINAQIDIMTPTGAIETETISAGYCRICKCFFILETDFIRLRNKGILLCQQITYDAYRKNGSAIINGEDLKPESLLHQCGYNVSAIENLSSIQRREILCRVVDNGLYSISGICSHLDWLISRNKKVTVRDMSLAIAKWEDDRKFISHYNANQNKKVAIRSIKASKDILINNYDNDDNLPF